MGHAFKIRFKQDEGIIKSIISNQPINKTSPNVYYEFEVDDYESEDIDIVIGFTTKEDYSDSIEVGKVIPRFYILYIP